VDNRVVLAADNPDVADIPGVDIPDGSDSRRDGPMDVQPDDQADGRDGPVIGSWRRAEAATSTDAQATTLAIVERGVAALVVVVVATVVAGQHFVPVIVVVAAVMTAPVVVVQASVAVVVAAGELTADPVAGAPA
jgi:hypothetical protein